MNDSALPVAPWKGGKRLLARRIIERIQAIPHQTYAEPFVGMGGVFLRRPKRARFEVINDWDRDVSNLFRVVQVHYHAFIELLRFQITSRAEFDRWVATDPETLTDMQRAARFLFLQRLSYGGKLTSRTMPTRPTIAAKFDVRQVVPMLDQLHQRLAGVTIERMPYGQFIDRYDRAETLFYCDPPYWGCEDIYGRGLFERADFERLATQLGRIRGRFILSINDTPEVRTIFSRFAIEPVETTYSVTARTGDARRVTELLITN